MVATGYLIGVSTRRVDKRVEQLGIKHISKSQVSEMAKVLDVQVEALLPVRNVALAGKPAADVLEDQAGLSRGILP